MSSKTPVIAPTPTPPHEGADRKKMPGTETENFMKSTINKINLYIAIRFHTTTHNGNNNFSYSHVLEIDDALLTECRLKVSKIHYLFRISFHFQFCLGCVDFQIR